MNAHNQKFVEILVRHLMAFRNDWRDYIKAEIQEESQKEFHVYAIRALGAMISALRRWLTQIEARNRKQMGI